MHDFERATAARDNCVNTVTLVVKATIGGLPLTHSLTVGENKLVSARFWPGMAR